MPSSFYFQVTLEPHLKRFGTKTGRKIFFLVEIPQELAVAASEASSEDQDAVKKVAERLAIEFAPSAMNGRSGSPGEDQMTASCQFSEPTQDLLRRAPDAEENGARVWLLGTDPS